MIDVDGLVRGVLASDRASIARAITLVESEAPAHFEPAQAMLGALLPKTGGSFRLGVSGVPGVGKSTLIDVLGTRLTAEGRRVAVLAVDPSSQVSRGSILGDKTRMQSLARDPLAYVRPSPTGGSLGGVARKTREALLICEAAGFDVVMVETVGVGQSETGVADLVDVTLVLLLSGAGDELQGIKRGILEAADVVAIQKADGENLARAQRAQAQLTSALRMMRGHDVPVLTCSAQTGHGLAELWDTLREDRGAREANSMPGTRRASQARRWMWRLVEDALVARLRHDPAVRERATELELLVERGERGASAAAAELVDRFLQSGASSPPAPESVKTLFPPPFEEPHES